MSKQPTPSSTGGASDGIIDTRILSAYGTLSFPLAAAFITLQVIVPTFYAESTGLTLSQVGLILLLARLWDMFTDPVVGMLSDLTPARLGRRKLWVIMSFPLICLATWKLFNPPEVIDWVYLLVWTFVIYVAGTMAIVPMNAWGAELSPRYNQRSRVSGMRAIFGLAGTLTALLLAALSGSSGSAELDAPLQWITWLVVASLFVSVLFAGFLVPDRSDIKLPGNAIRSSFKLVFEPSPFRQLIFSFLLNGIGNAIPATLFLLYVSYVLVAPQQAGPGLFVYFICTAISVPVWTRLSRRFGKHQTWIAAICVACCFFIWTPFLSSGDLFWFYIIVGVTGFTAGADIILPIAMKGDLIEWDAHKNGLRRPGLFFAIWGTATKLAFALAIGLAFPLLELVGFSTEGEKSGSGVTALAFMYGLPCVAFKLTAAWMMRTYPITQAEHERISALAKEIKD